MSAQAQQTQPKQRSGPKFNLNTNDILGILTVAGIGYVVFTPQGKQILGGVTKSLGDVFKALPLPDTGGTLRKTTGGTVKKTTGVGKGTSVPPDLTGGALSGGTGGVTAAPRGTKNIYPVISRASISNPAGQNQSIHYASSGKAAQSHRCDVSIGPKANLEATVYLAWPSGCQGGGHPELAVKFYGPGHTDSSCCYCYTSAVPSGSSLQIGMGGEGPHPSTTTMQHQAASIPFQTGKLYGIKGVIWKTGGTIHQESWYDAGTGWKLAGTYNRASCGKSQTSPNPSSNAQVEFRIDCSNVTYSGTDVAEIRPPTGGTALGGAGYVSSATQVQEMQAPTPRRFTKDDYNRILAIRKRHALFNLVRAVDPAPHIKHQYYLPVVDYQNSCD